MKAVVEFNLEEPYEEKALLRFLKSEDIAYLLWQIYYNMKKSVRQEFEALKEQGKLPEDVYDELDYFYYKLGEKLEERDINLDYLIE